MSDMSLPDFANSSEKLTDTEVLVRRALDEQDRPSQLNLLLKVQQIRAKRRDDARTARAEATREGNLHLAFLDHNADTRYHDDKSLFILNILLLEIRECFDMVEHVFGGRPGQASSRELARLCWEYGGHHRRKSMQ